MFLLDQLKRNFSELSMVRTKMLLIPFKSASDDQKALCKEQMRCIVLPETWFTGRSPLQDLSTNPVTSEEGKDMKGKAWAMEISLSRLQSQFLINHRYGNHREDVHFSHLLILRSQARKADIGAQILQGRLGLGATNKRDWGTE